VSSHGPGIPKRTSPSLVSALTVATTLLIVATIVTSVLVWKFGLDVLVAIGLIAVFIAAYGVFTTLALARHKAGSAPPSDVIQLSGSKSLSQDVLFAYYSREHPLGVDEGRPILQTMLHDHSDSPIAPDRVRLTMDRGKPYALPPELGALALNVTRAYMSLGVEYRGRDRVGVVNWVSASPSDLHVGLILGRMVDEYTTIQNPEMNYENQAPTTSNRVEEHTVRSFFATPPGGAPSGHAFSPMPSVRVGRHLPTPAYRLASHVVLLLKDEGESWSNRDFFLQKRSSRRLAIGAGEITSSMGSGIDYRDVVGIGPRVRGVLGPHRAFTNYVLRELRYEVLIQEEEIRRLGLFAVSRDMERLGQPVFVLLGETSLTFGEVEARWKEANLHPPRWGNPLGRGTGREHWEAENLLHRRIREIDDLLLDPNVQSSTKTCLHLLKKRETPYVWEKLPIWRN